MQQQKIDARLRASAIVSSLVLIALVWYGLKSKRKAGYYLLSIFILAPTAGWLTAAISGPLVIDLKEEETAEPETEETTK